MAVMSMKAASLSRSTLPASPCLRDPTMALPNLWVMLLATAMTPWTPRFIMPGVMKKAPPLPMNPLKDSADEPEQDQPVGPSPKLISMKVQGPSVCSMHCLLQ